MSAPLPIICILFIWLLLLDHNDIAIFFGVEPSLKTFSGPKVDLTGWWISPTNHSNFRTSKYFNRPIRATLGPPNFWSVSSTPKKIVIQEGAIMQYTHLMLMCGPHPFSYNCTALFTNHPNNDSWRSILVQTHTHHSQWGTHQDIWKPHKSTLGRFVKGLYERNCLVVWKCEWMVNLSVLVTPSDSPGRGSNDRLFHESV